jgi:hypothetical protein
MITVKLLSMFGHVDPYYVSNSQARLGDDAKEKTWRQAMLIAARTAWLVTPLEDACDEVLEWARETGAWGRSEIQGWDAGQCLALLVQNLAADLRALGSDNVDLAHDDVHTVAAALSGCETSSHVYVSDVGELLCDWHGGV